MANDLPVHKVLLAQMDELRARMEVLRAHLDQHALLDREDAIHELQQSLAELQTAHDELRAQGDELAGVQYQLEGERHRYHELFDAAPLGYLVTDAHGTIREVNQAAARMLGIEQRFLLGKPLSAYVEADVLRDFRAVLNAIPPVRRIDAAADLCDIVVGLQPRGGAEPIDASVTFVPVRSGRGELCAIRWMLRDVTDQRRAERQVAEANQTLERRVAERTAELANANRTKDRFLAALSHELRTPLTPALATVAALQARADLPAEVRDELEVARRNIELETRLIDDLLDLTRVAHEKLALDLSHVNVHDVVRAAADICYRGHATAEMPILSLDLRAARHHVRGDAGRLSQVFWNLLRNAVKFTPAGGSIHVRTFDGDDGMLGVEVSDTGVGIEPHVLPRLFSPFEQGEPDVAARQGGGLGLGLAISKALVEAHGGRLGVRSEGSGRGSRFTVRLPPAREVDGAQVNRGSTPAHGQRAVAPPPPPLHILLVEDHPDTARVLARLLSGEGHHVHVAGTVGEALRVASDEALDLIISDVGLPDGRGTDLLRTVRARRPIPGIALTGYGAPDDVRETSDAGFAAHLTKPIELQSLREAIARTAALPAVPAPAPRTS